MVPIAPSSTRMRCDNKSRSARADSVKFRIRDNQTSDNKNSPVLRHTAVRALKSRCMATYLILAAFPQGTKPLLLNGCFWPLNGDFRPWKASTRHFSYITCPGHL